MKTRFVLIALWATALVGCQKAEAPPASPPPAFKLTASIQELMVSMIDPSADAIWESVSMVSTEKGTQINQPKNDEEWLALRHRAVTLLESSNLLMMQGRRVAQQGSKIEGEGTPDSLSPAQIQTLIEGDRSAFATLAVLKAIDAKDAQALLDTGGVIDAACEGCHKKFWYPEPPPAK
jgi:redox-regulated HSP33 family molecular chaperone